MVGVQLERWMVQVEGSTRNTAMAASSSCYR